MAYFSFLPTPLPPNPEINLDSNTKVLLREATANLGLLMVLPIEFPINLFSCPCIYKRKLYFRLKLKGVKQHWLTFWIQ